jgi:hypothetical protein
MSCGADMTNQDRDADRLALADELREIAGKLINGDVEDGSVPVAKLCKAADLLEETRATRRDEPAPYLWVCLVSDDVEPRIRAWTTHADRAAKFKADGLDMQPLYAHPAESQGGVPGCGVPGCNDPTCDYGHEPVPSRPAAQPMREALEGTQKLLISAAIGSCTCMTKSPELLFHTPDCRYLKIMTALENVESLVSPASANEVKP